MTRAAASNSELSHSQASDERVRPAFWILVVTVVVVTLGMAPGLHYFDVTPKLVALAAGACLVWIALAAANRLPAPGAEQRNFFRLLWGLAVVAVLSTVFSHDVVLSLAGTEGRRLGLPALLATLAIAAAVPSLAGSDPGGGVCSSRRLPSRALPRPSTGSPNIWALIRGSTRVFTGSEEASHC